MNFPINRIYDPINTHLNINNVGFQGIEYNIEVDENWKNWIINFLNELRKLRENEVIYNHPILNDYEKWFNSYPNDIKCNKVIYFDNKWSFLPPNIMWISSSGRYACIELGEVFEIGNYFLLWDILNEELMKLEFHDLEGMNEDKGILYCRTHNGLNPHKHNYPLHFNIDNINLESDWILEEDEDKLSILLSESEYAHELVIRIFGTELDEEFDLSNSRIGDILFKNP